MRILVSLAFATLLPACTLVEGDRILGHELAAENGAFAGIEPQADIGPAPAPGSRRTFQYYELDRIAKKHSITVSSHEACFERTTVLLTADSLQAALERKILDFSRNPLPVGKPEFLPDGLAPNGLWRGRWLYGENRSIPIWARVSVPGTAISKPSAGPAVHRSDKVRVEVRSGGVLLAFDAEAENSGHTGERVTVRNPSNGQRFRALVEAPGKVSIKK